MLTHVNRVNHLGSYPLKQINVYRNVEPENGSTKLNVLVENVIRLALYALDPRIPNVLGALKVIDGRVL